MGRLRDVLRDHPRRDLGLVIGLIEFVIWLATNSTIRAIVFAIATFIGGLNLGFMAVEPGPKVDGRRPVRVLIDRLLGREPPQEQKRSVDQ